MTNESQTVAQALQLLHSLQSMHNELREFEKLLHAKPQELESAKQKMGRQQQAVEQANDQIKEQQAKISQFELELKANEDKIAKLREQQNAAKTNREFKAFQDEIDNWMLENSRTEDKILECMTLIDAANEEVAKAKRNVDEEEKRLAEKQAAISEDIAQIQDEYDQLKAQYDQTAKQVDPRYLAPYERLLANRNGIAIAKVKGQICGCCFMNLTPQTINALMGAHELVFCHSCGRILCLDSPDGDDTPSLAGKKPPTMGPKWKKIERQFRESMGETAERLGMAFGKVRPTELTARNQYGRTWGIWKQTAEDHREYVYITYFKIKSVAEQAQWYDWGVTGKIMEALASASARVSAPWGILLLLGGPSRGYLLPESEVEARRKTWDFDAASDQYKIKQADLPRSLLFQDLDKLFALMGLV